MAYAFAQFAADLEVFGLVSAEDLTLQKLAGRHRSMLNRVNQDKPDGSEELTKALSNARDRLKAWHFEGRPPFTDGPEPEVQPEPQAAPQAQAGPAPPPGYGDPADAEKTAKTRADERAVLYRKRQEAEDDRIRKEKETLAAAKRELERIFFWRRWRRRAMWPLRAAWWGFAHFPIDRVPWVVGGLALVLLWPFVQDSRFGPYVPHFPSVYAWLGDTAPMRYLKDPGNGRWINNAPSLDSSSNRNRRCSTITRECWYTN